MTGEDSGRMTGVWVLYGYEVLSADGERLPAKVKPHNASHLHTTLNYSTG